MRDSSSVGQGGLVDNLERRSGSHSTLLRRLKFLASPGATSGVLSVPPRFFWAIGYSKPALDQLLQEYASLLSVH